MGNTFLHYVIVHEFRGKKEKRGKKKLFRLANPLTWERVELMILPRGLKSTSYVTTHKRFGFQSIFLAFNIIHEKTRWHRIKIALILHIHGKRLL
jgi:hypothetical protein